MNTAVKHIVTRLLATIYVFCLVTGAALAWTTVGTGIDYQTWTTSDPNHVYVARMLRSETSATIDTTIANSTMKGAREIVRDQASRQDDALTWWGGSWGQRNDVAVAINGGFFTMSTGVVTTGQIQSGWYAQWFADSGGFSGFAWTLDRVPFVGQCVSHNAQNNRVYFVSAAQSQTIKGINRDRGSDELILYTPQYDSRTPAASSGVEVVVEMAKPNVLGTASTYSVGYIREIRQNTGATWIPFDHIVISASGTAATNVLTSATVGGEVRIYQELTDKNEPTTSGQNACQTATGQGWQNTFASVNVNYHFLENGAIRSPDPNYSGYAGMIARNPRTCICYNADYVFFVVCDGRTTASIGWTSDEMATFCKNTLGATDGVNLDGGGSSTMVVNGILQNVPSDGYERTVANGVVMVNLLPKEQTHTFGAGQTVTVTSATSARLGPGTNYAVRTSVGAGATGTVQSHALNGILAKGSNWWRVSFSGTVGWVGESSLVAPTNPPIITQQPASRNVSEDSTATFSVVAAGPGTLSYRWQKNNSDLSNGGHYSDVDTATLTVSNCDSGDVASYRCIVTNSYGSTPSNSASLVLGTLPTAPAALPASGIGTDSITWNWGEVAGATSYKLWTASSGGTQVGGTITGAAYTENGLDINTSYTRYVETWNEIGPSSTRTQLGPTSTTARYCPENGDFESGFTDGIGNHWIKIADDGTSVFAQATSIKHGGTSSQRIEDPSGGQPYTGWLYQKLNVQPSRQYSLSYWHYHTGTSSPGFVTAIGCDVNGGTSITTLGESNSPLNDWAQKKPAPITSGAGGIITIAVRGGANGGGALGYADDFALAPAPPTASAGATTICGGQSTTISASGGFGGSSSEFHWYTGPNGTGTHVGTGTTRSVSPTTTTTYYPRWESASSCGGCCASENGPSVTITVNPPPSAVTVTDEGSYTPSQNTLKASWTASTSACGINRYEYAVGTSSGTQNIKGWTSNSTSTSTIISDLSLVEGTTYYVQARAVDNYGNQGAGASANGILVAPGVSPISSAWSKANDTEPLSLRDKIVTAHIGDAFWLEETDRTCAIKVVSSASVTRGETVSVAGVLQFDGAQRYLLGDVVVNLGGNSVIQPLGVTCAWLGGGNYNTSTPGITGGYGQYNIGMLVRCWGKVTYYNTSDPNNKYFYLDDGSGLSSDGHDGVKVWCGTVNPPTSGTVIVTGVVTSESIGGNIVPVLMVRDGAEILTL